MDYVLQYYVGFSHSYVIGPMKLKRLLDWYGNIKDAYCAKHLELSLLIGESAAQRFIAFRKAFDWEHKLNEYRKKNIRIITPLDRLFPQSLTHIPDAPICIYAKGNAEILNIDKGRYIGIVGTRKPSSYGVQVAKQIGTSLSKEGVILVSGLAMGIDAVIHRSAIMYKERTIAVIGCGVDIPYPMSNAGLYDDILNKRGCIISEVPPGYTVVKGMFVARNRLISGLSQGVVIIEGLKNSGTLITAGYAAEQGKEVFAVPSPITSVLSEAPNMLLRQGAHVVTSQQDIFDVMGWHTRRNNSRVPVDLNEIEQSIICLLKTESLIADDMSRSLHISIQVLLKSMSALELKGYIAQDEKGFYFLTKQ